MLSGHLIENARQAGEIIKQAQHHAWTGLDHAGERQALTAASRLRIDDDAALHGRAAIQETRGPLCRATRAWASWTPWRSRQTIVQAATAIRPRSGRPKIVSTVRIRRLGLRLAVIWRNRVS